MQCRSQTIETTLRVPARPGKNPSMLYLSLLSGLWLAVVLVRPVRLLRFTSIASALLWARLFCVVLLLMIAGSFGDQVPQLLRTAVPWSAAVLGVAPFVDVLGARRPQHQAWPWFVITPMILVFHWPVVAQLAASGWEAPLEIPGPFALGYLLVVLMGCGNYFGTGNTLPAILVGAGLLCLQFPAVSGSENMLLWLTVGLLLLATAALLTVMPNERRSLDSNEDGNRKENEVNQLWSDFTDLFGMVWAKRVMDRVNQFASRESWPVRLSLFGFVDAENDSSSAPSQSMVTPSTKPIVVLCWVLRRFLDREFMNRYVRDELICESLSNAPVEPLAAVEPVPAGEE